MSTSSNQGKEEVAMTPLEPDEPTVVMRTVQRSSSRWLSDFLPLREDADVLRKLRDNLIATGGVQAAVEFSRPAPAPPS